MEYLDFGVIEIGSYMMGCLLLVLWLVLRGLGDSVSYEPLQPMGSNLEHLNLGSFVWQPPELGWFKLNTDASMDVQHGMVG